MEKNILIIGGAGFIGTNAAEYYLKKGEHVTVLDNFSRKGSEDNANWLKQKYPSVNILRADITKDFNVLSGCVNKSDVVLHLAAQVAVTTSVANPRFDFESNLVGTFNVLEALREAKNPPIAIYSSTNKVYGRMEDLEVIEKEGRYEYKDCPYGVCEKRQLDFHSPYGCSKGAGDQYFIDFSRIYGLRTVVLRQSCIYGPRQFGVEDQGWLAWLAIASLFGKQLNIYGDGKQVRDVLYVTDLIDAFDKVMKHIAETKGKAYNIGGGYKNTLSLLELIKHLETLLGKPLSLKFHDWRPGDQKVFVCDIKKAKVDFNWEPKIQPSEGIINLFNWVRENKDIILKHL